MPVETLKLYYSIGEVSDMLNINASQIRHWEKQIQVLNPKKQSNGNRAFTKEDIQNIKLIQHLVNKGYTLDGANRYLVDKRSQLADRLHIIEKLQKIRSFLEELKK